MKASEKYLARLLHEKEVWEKKLNELPGNSVDASDITYRMAVNSANKYYAAKAMYDYMINGN